MDDIFDFLKRHQLAIYGPLEIYIGQEVIAHPVFFLVKYQKVIDLRPFELPFGSALITIGIIMIYLWIKPFLGKNYS